MTDENYKELTAAVRESGIPLQLQKKLQILIDEEYRHEASRKVLTQNEHYGLGVDNI